MKQELNIQHLHNLPIGVFDSGIGGLTVLNALEHSLPNEQFLYLGDTARLPYGTKSAETIMRYAEQNVDHLLRFGVKMVVIACNTASAVALSALQQQFPNIPIIGVIKPGAIAACEITRTGHIAVIGTECTIRQRAYQHAIEEIHAKAKVAAASCSLFVPLAEEGWIDGAITTAICHRYLDPLLKENPGVDCLLLGCTHFPVLLPALKQVLPNHIQIIDSAHTTAKTVAEQLQKNNAFCRDKGKEHTQFLVTDGPERFKRLAEIFLGRNIEHERICLI